MNAREFQTLLQAPFWTKELVVWNAPLEALDNALAIMTRRDLDLLDLLPDDERLPSARDDRGDLIRRELDQFLQSARPENSDRIVLVVYNPAILARYSVGLQPFYDWFGGAKSLTVLALGRVNSIELPNTLAGEVILDSKWLLDYFRSALNKPDYICGEADGCPTH